MRYFVPLLVIALVGFAPAAPRLPTKAQFTASEGEGYGTLVGPDEVARTEMKVTFTVRGKRGKAYAVELYVEANGTGEKAEWLRTTTATPMGPSADEEGTVAGEFKVRTALIPGAKSPDSPYLPYARSAYGWSYLLVLKDGDQVVASFGPERAPFVRKEIRVPE